RRKHLFRNARCDRDNQSDPAHGPSDICYNLNGQDQSHTDHYQPETKNANGGSANSLKRVEKIYAADLDFHILLVVVNVPEIFGLLTCPAKQRPWTGDLGRISKMIYRMRDLAIAQ